VREYVYYPETFEPLTLIEGAGTARHVYHYHNDPNGCPTRLIDAGGEVRWGASYTAWGAIATLHVNEVESPIRLQGQYEDRETGFHYNRYRYYLSAIGQYVSPDPIGLAGGSNPFTYGHNPVGWIDPLGLADLPVSANTALPDVLTRGVHVNVHDVPGHGSVHVGVRPDHLGGIKLVPADPATKRILSTDPSLWKKISGSVERWLGVAAHRAKLAAVADAAKKAFAQRGAEFAHLARNLKKGCGG